MESISKNRNIEIDQYTDPFLGKLHVRDQLHFMDR